MSWNFLFLAKVDLKIFIKSLDNFSQVTNNMQMNFFEYFLYILILCHGIDCIPPECAQVISIWLTAGGSPDAVLDDCCQMIGVGCFGSKVDSIFWDDKGLSGIIPPEIGDLINIRYLYDLFFTVKLSQ